MTRRLFLSILVLLLSATLTDGNRIANSVTVGTAPSKTNLKAWYRLGSGLTNAVGTGPGTLTNTNAVTFVEGKNSTAARCTESLSNFLSLSHHTDLASVANTAFSVSAFVKLRTGDNTQRVHIHKAGNFSTTANWAMQLLYDTSGNSELRFQIWDSISNPEQATYTYSGLLPLNTWIHISGTCSSANLMKCYINAVVGGTTDTAATRQSVTPDFEIGRQTTVYHDVDIDDVGVWNGTELSLANIQWLAAGGSYSDLP